MKKNKMQHVIMIAGPTASGKSGLAVRMAQRFNGVVINADSMQVYEDLHVLTARPGAHEMGGVDHFLYGVLRGNDVCSAGRWRIMATDIIREQGAKGKLPILVGGTGLYLEAISQGMVDIPVIPDEISDQSKKLYEEMGDQFHAEIAKIDPEMAAKFPPSDRQRLQRVWDVYHYTGMSLTQWQREAHVPPPDDLKFHGFALLPDRRGLYDRCNQRFDQMMEKGAMQEVQDLIAKNYAPDLPVMKAIGVRELHECMAGETTRERAVELASQATRQYAKRQMTWLRNRLVQAQGIDQFGDVADDKIISYLKNIA